MRKREMLSILNRAKKLIDSPEKWTKGIYGRDEHDDYAEPASCCKFCIIGAIVKASGATGWDEDFRPYQQSWEYLEELAGVENIAAYNDNPNIKHHHVMRLFDKATERLSK
jgi:hypothetical protein